MILDHVIPEFFHLIIRGVAARQLARGYFGVACPCRFFHELLVLRRQRTIGHAYRWNDCSKGAYDQPGGDCRFHLSCST